MAGQYPQYPDPSHPFRSPDSDPGTLPPPLEYPKRRRLRLFALIAVVLAVVGATVGAVVYAVDASKHQDGTTAGTLTSASAQNAIQGYLDALEDADIDTIARNTLCGMYDAVRDRRSDLMLARLNSDTFRKQFREAQVTSIDKLVFLSTNQAQVLFTMRVQTAGRSSQSADEQAIAQLLLQDNRVLVCQYLLRGAAQY